MNRLNYIWMGLLLAVVFTSCTKKEDHYDSYDLETVTIPMGKDYAGQYFYNLSTSSVVQQNDRDAWDLAFQAEPDGYHIFLNSAKYMSAYKTSSTNFDDSFTYDSDLAKYDASSGNPDSTAIGDWGNFNSTSLSPYGYIYLIDRGKDESSNEIGQMKFKVTGADDSTYQVTFANIDGTNPQSLTIHKDDDYNFAYLSFDDGQVDIEPLKQTWDLKFTMYTNIFTSDPGGEVPWSEGDTIPYLVNGVLLNPDHISIAMDTTKAYDAIDHDNMQQFTFSNKWDVIGWNWKHFDLNEGGYTTDTSKVYMIKSTDGSSYKLRFVDFYSTQGVKGYPTFQQTQME